MAFPLPPINLQREFATRVAEVRALEQRQAESRSHLDALFASLLDRAFKGEL
jgi:type I restriction enzyme S subunit